MDQLQKIGVTAFILNQNKVLIVKRSANENFLPGYYELPGGHVEFGESPEMALTREIKEEVNLNIKILSPYSTFSYVNSSGNKHTVDIQYIAEIVGNLDQIKISAEHDKFDWITKEQIGDYKFSKEMKKIIIKGFSFKYVIARSDSDVAISG